MGKLRLTEGRQEEEIQVTAGGAQVARAYGDAGRDRKPERTKGLSESSSHNKKASLYSAKPCPFTASGDAAAPLL